MVALREGVNVEAGAKPGHELSQSIYPPKTKVAHSPRLQ